MPKALFAALMLGLLLCGCGGGGSSQSAKLNSITITPGSLTLAPGSTSQFRATANFSNGTSIDQTSLVTWSSSNTAVAGITSQGVATAVSPGSSTISASLNGVSGSTTLTVASVQSITVTAPTTEVGLVGTSQQLSAVAHLSNGDVQTITSQVAWSSSNGAVVTVSPAGLATGVGAGTATVSATLGSVSGSVDLSYASLQAIALSPANPTLDAGETRQFTATGTLSNATTRDVTSLVTWSSANNAVLGIGAGGLASALSPGSTTVSAAFPGVPTASTGVIVLGPTSLTVSPNAPSVVAGSTQQFTAICNFADGSRRDLTNLATWSSSNSSAAGISNAAATRGLATVPTTATGSAIISAAFGGVSGSSTLAVKTVTSITVAPANPSVAVGATLHLLATGTFSDGSTQNLTNLATWNSSAPTIASVSNTSGSNGVVSGVATGSATISAAFGGSSGSTLVAVSLTGTTPVNRAYVTNFGSNNLTVIDTAGLGVVATVPVGSGPRGIAINPSTRRAYVANNDGNLSVLDLTTNALITTVNLQGGGGAWGVAVLPSANRVYVANSQGRSVSVLDAGSNTLVTTIGVGATPKGVAANPATGLVYVTNSGDNSISVINSGTNLVVATISGIGLQSPQDIALIPGTSRAYVTNSLNNVVSVINTANNTLVTTIAIKTAHSGIAVNTSTGRAYVTSSDGTVSALDTFANTEISSGASPVGVGPNPEGVAVKEGSNQLFVANNGNNTVTVLNTANDLNTVVATVPVGAGPTYIAVIP